MEQIGAITYPIFNYLLFRLNVLGLDSDRRNFREIQLFLRNGAVFSSEEFAWECFYVICVAGFRQDIAKAMCEKIIDFISKNPDCSRDDLDKIYGNKSKVAAIWDIWCNRDRYRKKFYSLATPGEKVDFLGTLPYVGNITKYHLARNLGLNFVKYDIWIQRLGTAFYGELEDMALVNNSKLIPKIKGYCDRMFEELFSKTGEQIGFIDVVLWRACQKGLIKIQNSKVFIDKNI
ncbi:MAG: hypothetical protein LBI70_02430 [Rickettsiales bacterium]|jgi:hypothetical protein|nr:hypothetical protein [Rickettsiales bacterium]